MGKVLKGLLAGIVTLGVIIGAAYFVPKFLDNNSSNQKPSENPPQSQEEKQRLSMVENIEYDYKDGVLRWDKVENADTYKVKIDYGNELTVNKNYLTFELENDITYFEIQACDSSQTYYDSQWTTPFAVTKIKEEESLVDAVNNFAISIAIKGNELDKIISVMPEGNYLVTTGVYEYDGEKYLLTDYTDCGKPVESLKEALKTEDAYNKTETRADEIAKDYDTEASYMARENGYSESIQRLVDEGYDIKFVTSQAYEIGTGTVGLRGIVKASKYDEAKFYLTDIETFVGSITNEEVKYTTAVEQADQDCLYENYFIEITGDFVEFPKQLDELQSKGEL